MPQKSRPPEVRPGQIWEDKDPRVSIRRVRVWEVDPGNGFTHYTRGVTEGRRYKSRTARFRTAFRFISQPEW